VKDSLPVADDIRAVSAAADWVDARIGDAGLSGERWHDLHVCLEEALANLILHAKASGDGKDLRIEVASALGVVTLVVRDRCVPFDLTSNSAFDPAAQPRDRIGGQGVRLLRALASALHYQSAPDGNELTMLFRETPPMRDADSAAIRAIPVFADLGNEALEALRNAATPLSFEAGDVMLEQGAPSEYALILLSGSAAILNQSHHREAKVAEIVAPALVGEIGALTGSRRSAAVRATTDVRALKIERGTLMAAGEHAPDLLVSVVRQLGSRIQNINAALGLYAAGLAALEQDDFDPSVLDELNNPTEELRAFSVAFRGLARKVIRERRTRDEMASAALIQSSMLPPDLDLSALADRWDVFGAMKPARHVAGDFYDHFYIDDDRLAVVVGDVCGKGVPAALFMCVTVTALRIAAQRYDDLGAVIARANNAICAQNAMSMFSTLFYGVVDLKTHRFDYVNCGHNPPYYMRRGACDELPGRAPPLGLFANRTWAVHTLTLTPGEGVFMFSDGVTESLNLSGGDYGDARLAALLRKRGNRGAASLVDSVITDVDSFAGEAEQFDDITCLALMLRK
jgi:serine phosphatase RsbU (regulator of sigma subunit)/anti-sigma regulatory factor (Ser/Thr protein kinase)